MANPMIGTAGWSIPAQHAAAFPSEGSHLERYSRRLSAVEINSSFYRPHRPSTYERWAATVPAHFRFAVKMPKEITHTRRLAQVAEPLARFLAEAGALGEKLGPILVQLPPSLAFKPDLANFFHDLRTRFEGDIACEPRHRSWFTGEVDHQLAEFRIARVAADPAVVPRAAEPGGWQGLSYYRLHGSPRMYYSAYGRGALDALAQRLAGHDGAAWCIFDNTAEGAATHEAMTLADILHRAGTGSSADRS
ncbi:DUF72 domain-containing protein [Dankookia sp. GCM10030260]|uniref:DUF72 domain-containing protein n=1 Tax=Dankookia sp. GCM10030260 TaxID=3273390 RepID=UPI00360686FE